MCLMALGGVTKNKPTFLSLPFVAMLADRLHRLGVGKFVILLECGFFVCMRNCGRHGQICYLVGVWIFVCMCNCG